MSQKNQKSKQVRLFDIDKESRKCYPKSKCPNDFNPVPVYVPQKLNRFQMAYRQMPA
jgi:hypothetical protein